MKQPGIYQTGSIISVLWLIVSTSLIGVHYNRVKIVPASMSASFPMAQTILGASDYKSPFWHAVLAHPPINPKITNGVSEMLSSPAPLFKIVPDYKNITILIIVPLMLIWLLAFLFKRLSNSIKTKQPTLTA